jgi:acyl carrier protein
LNLELTVRAVLDEVLSLQGRAQHFTPETLLLGHVPELDSMGVVSLLTAFEDQLHIQIEHGEMTTENFTTLGALVEFLDGKVRGL